MLRKTTLITLSVFSIIFSATQAESHEGRKPAKLLSDNIPYPFYDVQKQSEGYSNKVMIIDSGVVALEKRLQLINSAQKNIEVEYFIYATDKSAKIFNLALIEAAKKGVKVRILIDKSASIFEFDEFYASEMMNKSSNIEIKYYNSAPLYKVSSINFRNHRKLLSVDDKFAITGGRNMEDDYYDISEDFNFLDRDIYIEGPMSKTLRKSFDEYFKSKITQSVEKPKQPNQLRKVRYKKHGSAVWSYKEIENTEKLTEYNKKKNKVLKFLTSDNETNTLRNNIKTLALPILKNNRLHSCPEMTYSTDRPGGAFWTRLKDDYSDDYRYLRKTLFDKVSMIDKKITITSPYLINNGYSKSLMQQLLDKNIEFDLYTNSLSSTDALYVAANLYLDVYKWAQLGMNIYLHNGEHDKSMRTLTPGVASAKWGMHEKSQVYESHDSSEIMIGTYNIDNRSNHYNSEMAVFCKGNQELTNDMLARITKRTNNAYLINSDKTATDSSGNTVSVLGTADDDLLLMTVITLPSWLLKALL